MSQWDFNRNGIIKLDGAWEFYWNKNTADISAAQALVPDAYVNVPGIWNHAKIGGKEIGSFGRGIYRLKLILPDNPGPLTLKFLDAATAYNLRVNGKLVLSNGRVTGKKESYRAQYLPAIVRLLFLKKENVITAEVDNFLHYKGGLWESIRLGPDQEVYAMREYSIRTDLFLAGSFLIMALYHFGLFALRRKDRSSLLFGIFTLLIIIRMLVVGERPFHQAYPNFPYELGNKLEYLSVYMAAPVFLLFLYAVYREHVIRPVMYVILFILSLFCLYVVITPIYYYGRSLLYWQIVLIVSCLWVFYSLGKSIRRGHEEALAALIGFAFLFGAIINDILYSQNVIRTGYWMAYGLFAFIFSQSFMLSLRFSRAFFNIEKLSDHLQLTNNAYGRFVPEQFLKLLEKSSIVDIKLGDQIQGEMTVLFSDIRSFTELSETMSPKENFDFLNSYLKRMTPIIERNRGFIDKYIGDSIMALFPRDPADAVRTAAEMHRELATYNMHRSNQNYSPLNVGIGIHTGALMLGIIGGADRMEPTVISDAVNLASRIEDLTKIMGANILISENTMEKIRDRGEFSFRLLGRSRVKGKKEITSVYQILDGYPAEHKKLFEQTREDFENAVRLTHGKSFREALDLFEKAKEINPADKSAEIYIDRCRGILEREEDEREAV